MRHLTSVLVAAILTTAVSGAAAQTAEEPASSPVPAAPRVELGAGGAWFLNTDGAGAVTLLDTRGAVRLTRTWALEGDFAFRPTDSGIGGLYRIQARWRLPIATSGGLEPHLTVGGAGFVSRWSYPAYDYERYDNGQMVHVDAASGWNVDAPMYPTIGIGIQQRLGDHLALRADLGVGFAISDYGIGYALMPSVGLSIPVGRCPAARATR
jgi:hypothetical protein